MEYLTHKYFASIWIDNFLLTDSSNEPAGEFIEASNKLREQAWLIDQYPALKKK